MARSRLRLSCVGLFAFVLSLGLIACNPSSDQSRSTADSNVADISVTRPSPSGTATPMGDVSHDGGAIQMERDALTRAEHTEIKNLARRVALDQQVEIEQMRKWAKEYK